MFCLFWVHSECFVIDFGYTHVLFLGMFRVSSFGQPTVPATLFYTRWARDRNLVGSLPAAVCFLSLATAARTRRVQAILASYILARLLPKGAPPLQQVTLIAF